MNIAQLLGELESAVSQAKTAGNRVQKAIEELKSVFGALGVEPIARLDTPIVGVSVVEPTFTLENEPRYVCPYCRKEFPPYRRAHRNSPHFTEKFRVARHIANSRRFRSDHGAVKDPIPW